MLADLADNPGEAFNSHGHAVGLRQRVRHEQSLVAHPEELPRKVFWFGTGARASAHSPDVQGTELVRIDNREMLTT